MDHKISVGTLTLCVAAVAAGLAAALVALEVMPHRFLGLVNGCIAIAAVLYIRRHISRMVAEREEIAYRLGQASEDVHRGSLQRVRTSD